jgi:hypothetical protein
MSRSDGRPLRRPFFLLVALVLVLLSIPAGATAVPKHGGYLSGADPLLALEPAAGSDASVMTIIESGDELGGFVFEGIPDGVGIMPGQGANTADVFVAHEQSTVPFFGEADFVDTSVSKLTLSTASGAVLDASVAISPDDGYLRFCSATMVGPDEGFSKYTFLVGEESNDIIDVDETSAVGSDPALAPQRQAGYQVALDTRNGKSKAIPGFGRLNHENTIVVPGDWDKKMVMLTTDDTFSGPSAQLYMYMAKNDRQVWRDQGHLWAFQVTAKNGVEVDPYDAFNGANDYLDIRPGDDLQGRFIRVPDDIADGTTDEAPQDALENWSNDNNVFQFIRLEDMDYDRSNRRVVYVADTGRSRVVPDAATGRLVRGPSGTVGLADNGAIFRFEFNEDNPKIVDSFTMIAQGDDETIDAFVPFRAPDNVGTSASSLMVQEDADDAKIWRHDFATGDWSHVATVTDPDGESSGIVDASKWFGDGAWLVTIQAHGTNQSEEQVGDVLFKREDGQLLLLTIPGS